MVASRPLIRLSWVIVILATMASSAGLFWRRDGQAVQTTTVRGQTAELYGGGLYRYDTLQKAAIFQGSDAVTLFLCIPLLVLAVRSYQSGSFRGAVLLTSMLTYFL